MPWNLSSSYPEHMQNPFMTSQLVSRCPAVTNSFSLMLTKPWLSFSNPLYIHAFPVSSNSESTGTAEHSKCLLSRRELLLPWFPWVWTQPKCCHTGWHSPPSPALSAHPTHQPGCPHQVPHCMLPSAEWFRWQKHFVSKCRGAHVFYLYICTI